MNAVAARVQLYGIAQCDTVKKSRQWFASQGVDVQWHDFKKQGLDEATLAAWCAKLGWQALLNRRGTTWRGLDPQAQAQAGDATGAQALMLAHTSLIKRPVVRIAPASGGAAVLSVGYVPEQWAAALAAAQ
ncbi:arsenate reductase [Vandammella animalimorsus]|uniref:Arsenate reductase n=1 Tax=Vandammella animalimorsus TaxID=2029117 RepID=A0A2A2ACW7_9BURK|nr:arsenate reductase [Vandammella animalimorsus]PAT36390.1 arsenate reductase [Vandammella animalimorsus]